MGSFESNTQANGSVIRVCMTHS